MRTQATVISLKDGLAVVETARTSACEGCHKNTEGEGCSVCTLLGGQRNFSAVVDNAIGASVGDRVIIESSTKRVIWYAALVFLLPLLTAAMFLGLAAFLHVPTTFFALIGCGGFVLCFVVLALYSRQLSKKHPDIAIVEILS